MIRWHHVSEAEKARGEGGGAGRAIFMGSEQVVVTFNLNMGAVGMTEKAAYDALLGGVIRGGEGEFMLHFIFYRVSSAPLRVESV